MKKSIMITNYIMLLILVTLMVCYTIYGGLWLKALTSSSFVLLGCINTIYVKKNASRKFILALVMLIGMVLGMCGDVLINIEFIPGVVAFALGHVFYLISYNIENKICVKDFIAAFVLATPTAAFLFLTNIFNFGNIVFSVAVFLYCIIISMMTSKSIMNAITKTAKTNKLWAAGSIMFFFSDVMLVLDMFADTPRIVIWLCLLSYYPAQWLLAHGIFHLSDEQ